MLKHLTEDLAEMVFSPFGFGIALVLGATRTQEGKRVLRSVMKETVKAGYSVAQVGSEWFSRACDEADKIISEAEAERSRDHVSLIPLKSSQQN